MFWRYNRAAFLWAILILVLCGLPGSNFPKLSFLEWLRPDKIVHLILFGIQSYLLIIGFIRQDRFPGLRANAIRLGVLLSISYGALVEVLQTTVFIGRSGDICEIWEICGRKTHSNFFPQISQIPQKIRRVSSGNKIYFF